jgi:hypothetical protein
LFADVAKKLENSPASAVDLENLLTEQDLAKILRRSVKTIRKDRLFGRGPRYIKVIRSVRYKPSDVVAYLDSCPAGRLKQRPKAKEDLPVESLRSGEGVP